MKNSSKTTIRRTLSFILTLVLIFIPFTSMVSGETISTGVVSNPETKLTENLKAYLETVDDDEYVPIYIWLTDYDEAVFYSLLSKRLGTTITAQTEEAYIGNKVAEKAEAFENRLEEMKADSSAYSLQATEAGEIDIKSFSPMLFRATANISSIMTDTEIENCLNSGMSSREIINLSQRNEFLSSYRTTRKALNNSITDSFQQKLDLGKCRNIYPSVGLTYITLEAKKSYINTIAAYEQVEYIDLEVEVEFVTPEAEMETTDAESTYDGYHMTNSYSYDGSGIKIGVLEAGEEHKDGSIGIRFDNVYVPYLAGKSFETDPKFLATSNTSISEHANKVLSLIGGVQKSLNESIYQGVAPNALIYYTNSRLYTGNENMTGLEEALNWLVITGGVNIVNMSLYYKYVGNENYEYTIFDGILDKYVLDYRVVFVVSAGNINAELENFGIITSPAKSYNVISVGNATVYNIMNSTSCYMQSNYLTNKPDVSAYGTDIIMPQISYDGKDNIGFGTSYAAPQVAGAAALMMQANPDLIGKPDTVKALLIGSANENAISFEAVYDQEGNIVYKNDVVDSISFEIPLENQALGNVFPILREKSGAGLLNVEASIRMANSDMFYPMIFNQSDSTVSFVTETYTFSQGINMEIGLVFEKNNSLTLTSAYSNDFNIEILNSENQVVFASSGNIDNVEVFVVSFSVGGDYRFRITATSVNYESPLNATFFLTCSCAEKMLSHSDYTDVNHMVSCGKTGCDFVCQENHELAQIDKNLSSYGITTTFGIYYLSRKYPSNSTSNFDYLGSLCLLNYSASNSNYVVETAIIYSGNTETTATGEIITRTFEMVVRRKSDNTYLFPLVTVTMRVDYFDQTVYLS